MSAARGEESCELILHGHGEHGDGEFHHHHSHAQDSCHVGKHHLLTVEHLTVSFAGDSSCGRTRGLRHRGAGPASAREVLHDLTLSVHHGELVAVVGASGSGKSVLADSLLGLFEPNADVRGSVWFDGKRVDSCGFEALRGRGVGLVPQTIAHLDPLMRIGVQVQGVARGATKAERRADEALRRSRQRELFEAYDLDERVARMYPHELSGGMARRVLLMCALMESPRVLIADEPTPGLDPELAKRAVDDLRAYAKTGAGVILITHDLALACRVADRVAVFKDGRIVEETAADCFADPARLRHPYSRALCRALSDLAAPLEEGAFGHGARRHREGERGGEDPSSRVIRGRLDGDGDCADGADRAARDRVEHGLNADRMLLLARGLRFGYQRGRCVIDDVSFSVRSGERIALTGGSGAGKSTLCAILAGYLRPDGGELRVASAEPSDGLCALDAGRGVKRRVQLISQHPELAFDPRLCIMDSLAEAGDVRGDRARELARCFGVRDEWLGRRPHELSGGELMRCCTVRAIMAAPAVLICDESTAMLDLVTQSELWARLIEVQKREGFGLVFTSHSPELVARMATRVVRLCDGVLDKALTC